MHSCTHKPSVTPEIMSTKTTCLSPSSIFFGCNVTTKLRFDEVRFYHNRSKLLWRVHLLTFNTFKRAFAV
jgi:hypothetical protein